MKEFFKSRKFKILVVVLMLMIGFMLQAASRYGISGLMENALNYVVTPLQKLSSGIADSASGFLSKFVLAGQIDKKNKELEEEIRILREQLVDYETYKQENEQYRDLLELKEHNPDYQFEPAAVIGRDPSDRYSSFTIDKGALHDVALGDPVITADGLVGRISYVGATYAKVTTILDPSSSLGVYDIKTRETAILSGHAALSLEGKCKLNYLSRESEAAAEDIIVTSGEGGVFPKDIIVGTITDIQHESSGLSLYAVIEPVVDIDAITDVVVLTYFLGQGSPQETP